MRRTRILAAVGAAALIMGATAACGNSDDTSGANSSGNTGNSSAGTSGGEATEAEVFTWWTTGSEALGLQALEGVFNTQYPDITFINGGTAGGGGSAKDVLISRLAASDPPDSFQAHAGAEMLDYINSGQVDDLSGLYDEFGLTEAFPQDLLDLVTKDGAKYSIPSNVHRANVMWASAKVLQDTGIDPTKITYASYSDFFADLDKIKAANPDITPLAIGGTWTQVHLLETVLIAELGAPAYNGLWDGSTDPAGAEVSKALATFEKALSYTNTDSEGEEWDFATQKLIDGTAAFSIMGDWVPAQFDEQGKVMGTDWLWAPSPGTDGVYDFLADSFTLPKGAPHPEGAKAWLSVIASVDGQAAFNKVKGSIPARTDVPLDDFSEYQKLAADAYAADTIVGSLQHGAAASIAQGAATNEAVGKFRSGASDLAQFQTEFAAAIAK
ncbi:MAG: ABC transporter substrate-binding protein [Bifidobacteriaceae bacterium]|jgi:glucose/mannose transport system substrate-binding protein|nr:ABC transporter substrate-binding protein [Bifidobacteriaceae bacterium]